MHQDQVSRFVGTCAVAVAFHLFAGYVLLSGRILRVATNRQEVIWTHAVDDVGVSRMQLVERAPAAADKLADAPLKSATHSSFDTATTPGPEPHRPAAHHVNTNSPTVSKLAPSSTGNVPLTLTVILPPETPPVAFVPAASPPEALSSDVPPCPERKEMVSVPAEVASEKCPPR
ncbi:MAG TPA: hypothetical protein VLJ57_23975 [Burkholderiaceae bacterium]|nr:hypothetical protein [Burkholderiaceae bacterium]